MELGQLHDSRASEASDRIAAFELQSGNARFAVWGAVQRLVAGLTPTAGQQPDGAVFELDDTTANARPHDRST